MWQQEGEAASEARFSSTANCVSNNGDIFSSHTTEAEPRKARFCFQEVPSELLALALHNHLRRWAGTGVLKKNEQHVKNATTYKWTLLTPVATTTGVYSLKIKHQLGFRSFNEIRPQQGMWLQFPRQPCSNSGSNAQFGWDPLQLKVRLIRKRGKLDLTVVWLFKKKEQKRQWIRTVRQWQSFARSHDDAFWHGGCSQFPH